MRATSYLGSSGSLRRLISGRGMANVVVGFLSVLALRLAAGDHPHVRYFFTLTIAFNLLFAPGLAGLLRNCSVWGLAAVISGLSPAWLWRALLVASAEPPTTFR